MAADLPLRPAASAPLTELEELLARVRRELVRRDEAPGGSWIDQAAVDLRSGAKPGFYVPISAGGVLAFYSRRGPMAFGHLHAEPGAGAVERAVAAGDRLLGSLAPDVASIDVGFTGLPADDEAAVARGLAVRPGSTLIPRQALERELGPSDAEFPATPPAGLRAVPVRDVTLEALADLDRRGFAGTVDALLVGHDASDYLRSIAAILDDQLGRFLDETSCAVLADRPLRLAGAVLTAERSPRRAVFLELMVDPDRRRHGLGRYLLGWGLRALWALGYERARLWVSLDNAPARALYASFGFRPIADATIYRWDRASSSAQPHDPR